MATSNSKNEEAFRLNIVIMTIGSRGDVQPYIQIGKLLKFRHGHRVRIATHPRFREWIEHSGLEFYSIGGDAATLRTYRQMSYISFIRALSQFRKIMLEIFEGFWGACINASDGGDIVYSTTDNIQGRSFVADAIIATPPCYAHIHCAQRLGVPLHLMSSTARSPTREIPHPRCIWGSNNVDPSLINLLSYYISEGEVYQLFAGWLNQLRVNSLGLKPISSFWAPVQFFQMRVPHTYLLPKALLTRPAEWGPEIDFAGCVLYQPTPFAPPQTLIDFLNAGDPPVYIGFGSLVIPNPIDFMDLVGRAIEKTGLRAIVCRGWSNLEQREDTKSHIFVSDDIPHDWLFPRVCAVVHHGGQGTTAMGLKHGRPTVVVPFDNDQHFWGARIAKSKAGALAPISYKHLTAENLAEAICESVEPQAYANAAEIAKKMQNEWNGAGNAVKSFHNTLRQCNQGRCSILKDRLAVLQEEGRNAKLSAIAAYILLDKGRIERRNLKLHHHVEWPEFACPGDPITGAASALMGLINLTAQGVVHARNTLFTHRFNPIKLGYGSSIRNSANSYGPVAVWFTTFTRLIMGIVGAILPLLLAVILGSYNFLDLVSHALSDHSYNESDTNLRLRGHPSSISLISRLLNGLYSLFTQPYTILVDKGPLGFFLELAKCIVRVLVCSLHVIVGAVALPVGFLDKLLQKRMDSPIGEEIVVTARLRQGRAEFELLASEPTMRIEWELEMLGFANTICLAWDAATGTGGIEA